MYTLTIWRPEIVVVDLFGIKANPIEKFKW
jgi:hypothetical protein